MSLPWKLQPKYEKVEVNGVTLFDVPLYPSQLVDEAILWTGLKKDSSVSSLEAAKRYVVHSLRLREVIGKEVTDEQLSALLSVDLVTELFELFFYGTQGKPEEIPLGDNATEKKKSTGASSSGSSNSTTPASQPSAKKTLVGAQST
ncbi:MAG: hypothetical protein AAFV85_23085 [Cyanobacteria bacterium J06634_6]